MVAMGTMYAKTELIPDTDPVIKNLAKNFVTLKVMPDVAVDSLKIAQLVALNFENIKVRSAWTGPARLSLNPHIDVNIGDFPVRKVICGRNVFRTVTWGSGRVLHDYLAK